jgi:hypothetical protein
MEITGIYEIEQLTEIIAGLVKQGLTFNAYQHNDVWTIKLLGGF